MCFSQFHNLLSLVVYRLLILVCMFSIIDDLKLGCEQVFLFIPMPKILWIVCSCLHGHGRIDIEERKLCEDGAVVG